MADQPKQSTFSKILQAAFPFATMGASVFGGPVAGALVTKLGAALGATPKDGQAMTPGDVEAAYINATPEQRTAARQVELDFQKDMAQMNIDSLEKLAALDVQDRASARAMQVQTRSIIVPVLAVTITVGFLGLLLGMLLGKLHVSDMQALLLLLGGLNTSFGAVVMYYFGSSAGSERKTELLAAAPPAK